MYKPLQPQKLTKCKWDVEIMGIVRKNNPNWEEILTF